MYTWARNARRPVAVPVEPIVSFISAQPEEYQSVLAVVYYSGEVLYTPAARFNVLCPLDLRRFPFDSQTCALKFGSWTYDGNKVSLFEQKN